LESINTLVPKAVDCAGVDAAPYVRPGNLQRRRPLGEATFSGGDWFGGQPFRGVFAAL
jgi:hypothetical protein